MSVVTDIKKTNQKLISFQTSNTPSLDTIAGEVPDGYKIVSMSVVPTATSSTTVSLKSFKTYLLIEPISANK